MEIRKVAKNKVALLRNNWYLQCNVLRYIKKLALCLLYEGLFSHLYKMILQKAIMESDEEWSMNNKLIDLSSKDVRKSVSNEMY